MITVAYLRVSTRSQDLANQKLAILEFSQKRRFTVDEFIEARISSGGTERLPVFQHVGQGLSPRVRGNRITSAYSGLGSGSIPACAGEPERTYSRNAFLGSGRVDPRCFGQPRQKRRAVIISSVLRDEPATAKTKTFWLRNEKSFFGTTTKLRTRISTTKWTD